MAWVALLFVLLLVATCLLLSQIIKQQGRMLLRIDELERVVSVAVGSHAVAPLGLPVGSRLDPFTVSDLSGREVSLSQLSGKKTLLVNWSPTCGYCEMIGPELAGLLPELDRANTRLVLLAHGDRETNRSSAEDYGLTTSVLLLGDNANPASFQGVGTPAAFLLDEGGKVASPLVFGADKVPALAREVGASGGTTSNGTKRLRGERSLTESRLLRDGLKAGTPAPLFELPDVYGNMVSLKELRGRPVLLVFSDPQCGPCEALAPHLVALDQESTDGLRVLLVSRGDVAENRRKAEEHGFRFPVVVQEGWKLSKEYGIFATPVAFLIDGEGVIQRDVAKGVDEILQVLSERASL